MTFLLYWITGDKRRCRFSISSPMEVEGLAACVRSFSHPELAEDLLREFGAAYKFPSSQRNDGAARPVRIS